MRKVLAILVAILLVTGCAKQGYPSGGPKDTEPPKTIGCRPQNSSRHFAQRQFYIEFDEYVVLKNADANVLISPPMVQKPEFSTKGKGVLVKLKDTLQPNTTYLFQFKEAIADFTEGNPLPSYEYVFSTGDRMDTMMIAGRVEAARDGKPWKDIVAVSAFRPNDSTPAYVTRTDKSGNFAFHYIPEGQYRLVAMEDNNKNWLPDSNEAIGWDTALFAAQDSIDSTRLTVLRMSSPDRSQQRVLKAEFVERGKVSITTLRPMQHPSVKGEPLEWRLNPRGDSLTVWFLNEKCDSTVLVLLDEDQLRDTLKLRYRASVGKSKKGSSQRTAMPLMYALCDGKKAFYDDMQIAFSCPVTAKEIPARLELTNVKDSTSKMVALLLDSAGMRAKLDTILKSGAEYRIRIPAGLFVDLYGHPTDSLVFKATPRDYGTITLNINNLLNHPLVVEVLDKKDSVVQYKTLKQSGLLRFSMLSEGEYRLRAVYDVDGNAQWTTGDYLSGRQPELFEMYEKTLQVREKWELEEKWTVGRPKATRSENRPKPSFPIGGREIKL